MPKLTVGEIRQQLALMDANTQVVLVDSEGMRVNIALIKAYPDTTDGTGRWKSTAKIQCEVVSND